MTRVLAAIVTASISLSGCLVDGIIGGVDDAAAAPGARPYSIVAVIDSGINAYHEAFRLRNEPDAWDLEPALAGLPRLHLTFDGDYASNVAADARTWASVEAFTLYAIPGTRILTIAWPANNSDDDELGEHMILDRQLPRGHGTTVAARVIEANPEAYVLMIHGGPTGGAEALRWAARQPWIDVVSVSLGTVANAPYYLAKERWVAASREAASSKLVFVAAGNEPTPALTDEVGGPPWVVLVGGANGRSKGEAPDASKGVEYVSDSFIECAPLPDSVTGCGRNAGTSFSAPYVAGAYSQALLTLRRSVANQAPPGTPGDGLVRDLREAFNASAEYWSTQDWNPEINTTSTDPRDVVAPAVLGGGPVAPAAGPIGPWQQMGWGYLGPGASERAVTALQGTSAKPPEAVTYMQAQHDVREAYWANACADC